MRARIAVAGAILSGALVAWLVSGRLAEAPRETGLARAAVPAEVAEGRAAVVPAAGPAAHPGAPAPDPAPAVERATPRARVALPEGGSAELSADRGRVLTEEGFRVALRLTGADGAPRPGARPYVVLRHSASGASWNSALVESPPGSGVYEAPFFPDEHTRAPGTLTVSLLAAEEGTTSLPRAPGPSIRLLTGVPARLRERALAQRDPDGSLRVRVEAVGHDGPVRVRASLFGDGESLGPDVVAYGEGHAELVFPPRGGWPEALELRDVDLVAGTPPRSVDRVASLRVLRADAPSATASP